ncbi:MAG: BTAD domain-containing putative transcriptional regulator [Armatimonadota bacterium]
MRTAGKKEALVNNEDGRERALEPPNTAALEIRLFGGISVRVNDRVIGAVHARKDLWVLALLALEHGRPVRRDALARRLWPFPEHTDTQMFRNLRKSLWHLRKALGSAARHVAEAPGDSLALDIEGARIDVIDFDRAVRRGDPASLRVAVERYTGPLLPECAEEWARFEREKRAGAFRDALLTLAAHAQAVGDDNEAVGLLRQAVAFDADSEASLRALMTALVRAGDARAALDLYNALRDRLHVERRSAPETETTALFRWLRDAPPGETPAPMRRAAESEADAFVGTGYAVAGNLPYPLHSLIGREEEIHEIRTEIYRGTRLITLVGAGGVGKTRLAVAAADSLRGEFPHGVWFADLAAITDPRFVGSAVADALGVEEQPARPLQDLLSSHIASRRLLLILDNAEHLVDDCAALCRHLLVRCPRLFLLVTSRRQLGLQETVWRVPSLAAPDVLLTELTELTELADRDISAWVYPTPAARLFTERARQAAGYVCGPFDAAAVAAITRRLDGIPLAIELAAAWVRALSVSQIAARLDQRFELVFGGSRIAIPRRQQTLETLIAWSFDLLGDRERILLLRLAVFRGGWTLEAAEAVCPEGPIRARDVLPLLATLIDHSLVNADAPEGTAARRYSLPETIREYLLYLMGDSLRDPEEGDSAAPGSGAPRAIVAAAAFEECRRRHATYAANRAAGLGALVTEGLWSDAQSLLIPDLGNIRAAVDWCRDRRDDDRVLAFGHVLGLLLFECGFWSDFESLADALDAALARKDARDARIRLRGLQGALARRRGQEEDARRHWEDRLQACQAEGNVPLEADTLLDLAAQAEDNGDSARARDLISRALPLAETLECPKPLVVAYIVQARLKLAEGEPLAAQRHAEAAADLLPVVPSLQLFALPVLGRVARLNGDLIRSETLLRDAAAAAHDAGRGFDAAIVLQELAQTFEAGENWQAAAIAYRTAARIHSALDSRWKVRAVSAWRAFAAAHPDLAETGVPVPPSAAAVNNSWREAVLSLLNGRSDPVRAADQSAQNADRNNQVT